MTSAWTATPGIAARARSTTLRVVRGQVPAAHAPEDAVVARLQRQVEMRQRARRALDPGREQVVVDVLGLDRAQPDPLDVRLGEDPAHEAREGEGGSRVRAAMAALRPAAVVGPDVDPGEDDLAVARDQGPPDVRQHRVRRQRPLGAAGLRDDAVGAVERAAVLDLDEGSRALDRRAIVGDPVDRGCHARQRRQRPGRRLARAWVPVPVDRQQRLELGEERGLALVADQSRVGVDPGERLGPDLDRTAGDDDLGIGVGAARAADGGARLLVGGGGDGARVDEVEVGPRDRGRRAGPRPRGAGAPRPPSPTG